MSYKILGKLPDPFMKADGVRMSAGEWYEKRDEIFRDLCEKEFGGMPPRPEVVRVERLSAPRADGMKNIYKIWAGTKEKQLTITDLLQLWTTMHGSAPREQQLQHRNLPASQPDLFQGHRPLPIWEG